MTRSRRPAFTLIELLVVISIIGIIVSILLPAIQRAREAVARLSCSNNLHQIGVAMHTYESTYRRLPSSGIAWTNLNGDGTALPVFDSRSTFTQLLSGLEAGDVYAEIDTPNGGYNTTAGNRAAAKHTMKAFLCPTNPLRSASGVDRFGYGYTDYMPVAAVLMIDGTTPSGVPNRRLTPTLQDLGGLQFDVASFGNGNTGGGLDKMLDGPSNTIIIVESVGRGETFPVTKYDPLAGVTVSDSVEVINTRRHSWRFAEPSSAGVVNGPGSPAAYGKRVLNNSNSPFGGPAGCTWNLADCGPNDEPFGFHGGGVNCLFGDGSVRYIREEVDHVTFRRMLTAAESLKYNYAD